jgi:hypothetical protein
LARETLDGDEIVKVAVDANCELPPSWKSENDEELDTELEDFLAQGETDISKAFVSGWNAGRYMRDPTEGAEQSKSTK